MPDIAAVAAEPTELDIVAMRCGALLEDKDELVLASRIGARPLSGAPTVANRIGDNAVLEYRPTETLPLMSAMLLDLARLCRPRRSPQPAHPRETAASRRRKANSRERQVRT